jgi:putative transposase
MPTQRRLPHIYPSDRWLFLTWHLHGSLPSSHFPPARKVSDGQAFAWVDRYLDGAHAGPVYLRGEEIATLVIEALFRGENLGHYRVGPFVVMANHVHLLLLPSISPSVFLKALKGATAREANRLLHRTGEPFWQRESYDHWVRDDAEWGKIAGYIERNPVKAGLVSRVEDYPWSSAHPRWSQGVHTSMNAARRGVPIAFRTTMAMNVKDLPAASSFTFEGACATSAPRILA